MARDDCGAGGAGAVAGDGGGGGVAAAMACGVCYRRHIGVCVCARARAGGAGALQVQDRDQDEGDHGAGRPATQHYQPCEPPPVTHASCHCVPPPPHTAPLTMAASPPHAPPHTCAYGPPTAPAATVALILYAGLGGIAGALYLVRAAVHLHRRRRHPAATADRADGAGGAQALARAAPEVNTAAAAAAGVAGASPASVLSAVTDAPEPTDVGHDIGSQRWHTHVTSWAAVFLGGGAVACIASALEFALLPDYAYQLRPTGGHVVHTASGLPDLVGGGYSGPVLRVLELLGMAVSCAGAGACAVLLVSTGISSASSAVADADAAANAKRGRGESEGGFGGAGDTEAEEVGSDTGGYGSVAAPMAMRPGTGMYPDHADAVYGGVSHSAGASSLLTRSAMDAGGPGGYRDSNGLAGLGLAMRPPASSFGAASSASASGRESDPTIPSPPTIPSLGHNLTPSGQWVDRVGQSAQYNAIERSPLLLSSPRGVDKYGRRRETRGNSSVMSDDDGDGEALACTRRQPPSVWLSFGVAVTLLVLNVVAIGLWLGTFGSETYYAVMPTGLVFALALAWHAANTVVVRCCHRRRAAGGRGGDGDGEYASLLPSPIPGPRGGGKRASSSRGCRCRCVCRVGRARFGPAAERVAVGARWVLAGVLLAVAGEQVVDSWLGNVCYEPAPDGANLQCFVADRCPLPRAFDDQALYHLALGSAYVVMARGFGAMLPAE